MTLDQSLSKCAWMLWEDNKILDYGVIRTGNSKVKTKKKGVEYFDKTEEQIDFICSLLLDVYDRDAPEFIIMEGLSFGSSGNATRDLAGLYYCIRKHLHDLRGFDYENWKQYAPTSLKAFARDYLDEEKQTTVSEKTGKPTKAKMDKKLMVEAARNEEGDDFLSKFNYSTGLDDIADAYWVGRKFYKEEVVC